MAQLELAGLAAGPRAGESPFFVAEQFGFQQVFGDRCAVDPHEGIQATGTGMVDGLGKELLAGAAFTGDQHRERFFGCAECLPLQFFQNLAAADDALERVARRAQGHQFFLVEFDLRFEQHQLAGQFADILDVFEHDLTEDGNDLAVFLNGDALHHHVLSIDAVGLVDFRFAGSGDDMHAAVFDGLGAVPSDLQFRIESQKPAVGPVEMGDLAAGIGHHGPVVDAVEYHPVHFQLILQLGDTRTGFHDASSLFCMCSFSATCRYFDTHSVPIIYREVCRVESECPSFF